MIFSPLQTDHSSVNRRRFLKVTGAGVAGASLLTMLDARQAPAQLKGTTLRILTWSHFIPAYDVWFDKFAAQWGEKNGVKVRVDHIPHLEIPARMAAEFAAGAGHDLILNNATILARLYYKSLVDMTDIYDQLGKKYGGWIPAAKSPIEVEGRIYGIPMYYILLPMLWRKDLFEANGLKPPDTWELARVAARTLKAKGNPAGMAFSHCNDANLNWRSVMFSFGAAETDPSGDNVMIDSKEMREALQFAKAMFDEGMTPEVFSWDDASDNRFLASGIAGWIHDAISAYRTTESTNPAVFKNTFIGQRAGGAGRQARQRVRADRLPGLEVLEEPAGGQGIPGPPRGQRQGRHDPEHRLQHALPERQRQEADADHRRGPEDAGPPGLPEDRGVLRVSRGRTRRRSRKWPTCSCSPISSRRSRAGPRWTSR